MNDSVVIYLATALGVAISIVLPILRSLLPKPRVEGLNREDKPTFWSIVKPYLAVGAFSLLVAVLVVVLLGDTISDWKGGLLAGYTSDSTLQKLTDTQPKKEGAPRPAPTP